MFLRLVLCGNNGCVIELLILIFVKKSRFGFAKLLPYVYFGLLVERF